MLITVIDDGNDYIIVAIVNNHRSISSQSTSTGGDYP